MRSCLFALCLASPAGAWDFTPGLPCVLTHKAADTEIELTYDPTQPLYTVTVTRAGTWPDAPAFVMRFDGMAGLMISTDRHVLSTDQQSVTVTDRGFGNVLNGLQFNDTVTAILGETEVRLSLAGAAGPVADFRVCRAEPGV